MLRILSLGAGVQSTTLALMAARGEIQPFDAAIFADTQSEPATVYDHLKWLETQLPFRVYRVTRGNLREEVLGAMRGDNRMDARPPFHTPAGALNRQCTFRAKTTRIQSTMRALAGIRPHAKGPRDVVVEQVLGISFDERTRMRDAPFRWVRNVYPLIDRRMARADCLRWCAAHGYPQPPKSACTFCPYHDDAMWREMKLHDPDSFADAVRIDLAIRPGVAGPKRPAGDQWFVHRSCRPLSEIDFSNAEDAGQGRLFDNECAGYCGV